MFPIGEINHNILSAETSFFGFQCFIVQRSIEVEIRDKTISVTVILVVFMFDY